MSRSEHRSAYKKIHTPQTETPVLRDQKKRDGMSHPWFTAQAKRELLSIENDEDRVETILFLLQTADESAPIIHRSDVRSAQLLVEMGMHLMGE